MNVPQDNSLGSFYRYMNRAGLDDIFESNVDTDLEEDESSQSALRASPASDNIAGIVDGVADMEIEDGNSD